MRVCNLEERQFNFVTNVIQLERERKCIDRLRNAKCSTYIERPSSSIRYLGVSTQLAVLIFQKLWLTCLLLV